MKSKKILTVQWVINFLGFVAVLFVMVAANGSLSGATTNPKLNKAEFAQKTRKLQIPFIANNGQMDEQVRFYAKTFGGTVFVTKDGEIVYALPDGRGRDVPDGASGQDAGEQRGGVFGGKVVLGWYGQAPLVRAESEFVVANAYSPFLHADNANCLPDRVFAKSLIAHLPGLLAETTIGRRHSSCHPITIRIRNQIHNPL